MNIFLTGATGFIGGAVARQFVHAGHKVRGLCRDASRAPALAAIGITPVIGTLDDADLLAGEARASDGVVHAANNMHEASVLALLGGLEGTGKHFLHTSGIGLISKDVQGDSTCDDVVDDASPVSPGTHPAQQMLYALEQHILGAQASGVRTVVLSNAMIYGHTPGLERASAQIALMRSMADQAGEALFIGRGVNRWSTVHIEDVAELYLRTLIRGDAAGFYFVESGEVAFADIAQALATRMKLGKARSASLAEASGLIGEIPARFLLGSEARVHASRARDGLGWQPVAPLLIDWIRSEMAA